MEDNSVQTIYKKPKAEDSQTICPPCNAPLQGRQPRYLSNYWKWNDKTRRYERDESGPDTDEPFCEVCSAEYWEALYR